MSRKAPPQKKRHTKPCKFFQFNRCPHPADVCNFAHVIASPPSDRDSSLYRYYPGFYAQDASPESNTTSSTSMSTLDLDEMAIVTDDPQFHEHLHSYQSQVYVEDNSPVIHVPPFSPYHQLTFNGPHTPPYSYVKPSSNLFKPRSSTRSTKQKNLKYKSKPCRFFLTERGCPKGSLCTFIHDELQHQTPSPIKESNLKEENCRKNYFPVPWRVIGGGVRVGITETEDSDLSYSTPNISRPPTSNFENNHDHDHDDTPTKILYRKRSNSNPPIPSPHSLQFKVEHLFSAESPGVL